MNNLYKDDLINDFKLVEYVLLKCEKLKIKTGRFTKKILYSIIIWLVMILSSLLFPKAIMEFIQLLSLFPLLYALVYYAGDYDVSICLTGCENIVFKRYLNEIKRDLSINSKLYIEELDDKNVLFTLNSLKNNIKQELINHRISI